MPPRGGPKVLVVGNLFYELLLLESRLEKKGEYMAGQAKLRGDFMERRRQAMAAGRVKKQDYDEQARNINLMLSCLTTLVDRNGGEMAIVGISEIKQDLELGFEFNRYADSIILTTKEIKTS